MRLYQPPLRTESYVTGKEDVGSNPIKRAKIYNNKGGLAQR